MAERERSNDGMIPAFLNDALGFNLYRGGLLFRRELARALKKYKITPEQWTVMATLWFTGKPLIQSEIVQLTMKDKHSTSRIVQRLERDGLIEKKTDANDARKTIIRPTPKGNSLKTRIPKTVTDHFDVLLKDYGDDEIRSIVETLKKLRGTMGDL